MSRPRCGYCGSAQHPETHCHKTAGGQSARLHIRCTYCGGKSHNYEACPRLGKPRAGGVWMTDRDKYG